MTKKGPLTKIEKFYIEHNVELGKKTLSQELNRTQKCVQSHIDSVTDTSHSAEAKTGEAPTSAGTLMARNDRGSTVMTEAASQAGDESKGRKKELGSRYTGAVTTIKQQ